MKLGLEHFTFGVAVGLTIWGISRWLEKRERKPDTEFSARIVRVSSTKQPPVSRLQ